MRTGEEKGADHCYNRQSLVRRDSRSCPMTAKEAVAVEPITKTPGVLGGAACIRGRRIAVWMLVQAHRLGFTDEELLQRYDPPLTAEELAAAWQYDAQHRTEIDAAIQDNERPLETDLGPLAKKDANGDTTA